MLLLLSVTTAVMVIAAFALAPMAAPYWLGAKAIGLAMPLGGLYGILVGYLVTKKSFVGRRSMELVSMIDYALPGTIVGIAYLVAFNDPPLELTGGTPQADASRVDGAAECAGVIKADDSFDMHFDDTVGGGDWLCEQDVVEFFVGQAHEEMVQMEHWGCPWSRKPDGHVNVRAFGGMKIERTWFAADKTGFHMLHTLFQTSIKYPSIKRFDEHFVCDLLAADPGLYGFDQFLVVLGKKRRLAKLIQSL